MKERMKVGQEAGSALSPGGGGGGDPRARERKQVVFIPPGSLSACPLQSPP